MLMFNRPIIVISNQTSDVYPAVQNYIFVSILNSKSNDYRWIFLETCVYYSFSIYLRFLSPNVLIFIEIIRTNGWNWNFEIQWHMNKWKENERTRYKSIKWQTLKMHTKYIFFLANFCRFLSFYRKCVERINWIQINVEH